MDSNGKDLLKRAQDEGSKKRHSAPLALTAGVSAAGFAACLAIALCLPPETGFKACVWTMVGTLEIALLAALWQMLRRRRSLREDAQALDSKKDAKNRLEAFVELSNGESSLKEAQAAEALAFYAGTPKSKWPAARLALIALIALFLCGEGIVVTVESALKAATAAAKAKAERKARAKEDAKQKGLADFARLELVSPEPESRAKPIDEILWQANGASSNGFDSLTLEISVNGDRKISLPIEGAPLKAKDEIALEGSLELEKLKVVPFDLVSYHVKGVSKIGDKAAAEILSPPQFIEVRPFREDARLSSGGESAHKKLNLILGFLKSELLLNKALYATRSSGMEVEEKELQSQLELIAKEQESLRSEVAEFLKGCKPEELSPNEFECLNRCLANMGEAVRKLKPSGAAGAKGKDVK